MEKKSLEVIQITPMEVRSKLESGQDITIVDVREDEEVAHGMIKDAIHIRLSELQYWTEELDPKEEIIFVCKTGRRSTLACKTMMELGYQNVKNMTGGMVRWIDENKKHSKR